MDSVMKGLMGHMPPRIFGLEPPLELIICVCTVVIYNTAQNGSDNLPCYPPDNHHSSDNVHRRRRRSKVQHFA